MTSPRIATIVPSAPFARTLAATLRERYGEGETLSRVLLLLPTRRACLAMREAFLDGAHHPALLLPRIEPLGEVDADLWMTGVLYGASARTAEEIPPAMPPAARIMKLARLVHRFEVVGRARRGPVAATMEHAVALAEALSSLLDECTRERVPPEKLREAASREEFARHWEISLEFLDIVLTHWPQVEREEGYVSPARRQDLLLGHLAEHWRAHPPAHPVIAAGTTGSIPATADLLSVIARLPEGEVVLPGLDTALDRHAWEAIGPTHPQYILKGLLERIGARREEVDVWGEEKEPRRVALLREAMLPPEASDRWVSLERDAFLTGDSAFSCVLCRNEEHEAAAIALALRSALETEGKTAMLVTPDRALARRVAGMLGRWRLRVDDSSGRRLSEVPAAVFLRLIADCAASDGAPVPLLSLLRHPFCVMGRSGEEVRRLTRLIETHLLRGVRPPGGMEGLLAHARGNSALPAEALSLLEQAVQALHPLSEALTGGYTRKKEFTALLSLHLRALEALAGEAPWTDHAGEKLHAALTEIAAHAGALGAIDPSSYGGVAENLLRMSMYQPPYGGHPRLSIVSPQEARMQWADLIVLGGLNEGVWPAPVSADPWMNDTMRAAVGLPPHMRAIGQSAHDVSLLACASEALLTRARKQANAPGIASRWWLRLQAVLGEERMKASGGAWAEWADALLSAPAQTPLSPPLPRPPLAARPTQLWATQVETLMRDPYRFYASRILGLRPLDPLDAGLGAGDFGEAVHSMLERFVQRYPGKAPEDARAQLEAMGREALEAHFHHPQVEAFWLPRIRRIAQWVAAREMTRGAEGIERVDAESNAERRLAAAGADYAICARIDRLERYADGSLRVIDYKTNEPPPQKDIRRGVACQLLLGAWIVAGRDGVALRHPQYWKVSGAREAGRVVPLPGVKDDDAYDATSLRATQEGLGRLLAHFADERTAYVVCTDPALALKHNDYEHLERRSEWMM